MEHLNFLGRLQRYAVVSWRPVAATLSTACHRGVAYPSRRGGCIANQPVFIASVVSSRLASRLVTILVAAQLWLLQSKSTAHTLS